MGLITERLVLRPMLGEPQFAVVMVTIGLSIFLRSLAGIIFGHDNKVFPAPFSQGALNLEGLVLSHAHLWAMAISGFMVILFFLFFKYSRLGLSMRGVANDQDTAMLMGISVKRVFALTWGISFAIAAVAGIFLSSVMVLNIGLSLVAIKAFPCRHSGRAGKYSRRYHRRFSHRRGGDFGRRLSGADPAGCNRHHIIRCPVPGSYDQAIRTLRQGRTGAGVDQTTSVAKARLLHSEGIYEKQDFQRILFGRYKNLPD